MYILLFNIYNIFTVFLKKFAMLNAIKTIYVKNT